MLAPAREEDQLREAGFTDVELYYTFSFPRLGLAAYKITLAEVAALWRGFDPDVWDSDWQDWDCV